MDSSSAPGYSNLLSKIYHPVYNARMFELKLHHFNHVLKQSKNDSNEIRYHLICYIFTINENDARFVKMILLIQIKSLHLYKETKHHQLCVGIVKITT